MRWTRVVLLSLFILVTVGVLYRWLLYYHGLTVTSWWRLPGRNEALGGKTWSLHQIGLAWDVIPVNEATRAVQRYMPFGKFVPESDHLHIQLF